MSMEMTYSLLLLVSWALWRHQAAVCLDQVISKWVARQYSGIPSILFRYETDLLTS